MTPKQVLELAVAEHFTYIDYDINDVPIDVSAEEGVAETLSMHPPMSDDDIDAFERRLPRPLPPDIRELISFATGFDLISDKVRFDHLWRSHLSDLLHRILYPRPAGR